MGIPKMKEGYIEVEDFLLSFEDATKKCVEISREKGHKTVLDIGGSSKDHGISRFYDYHYTNIYSPIGKIPLNFYKDDICNSKLSDNKFDVVYSYDVFEHIWEPWKAAEHCVRICKPGGLLFHVTLFNWRLHLSPVDCFRYTHMGLANLFERTGKVKTICCGYEPHKKSSTRVIYLGQKSPKIQGEEWYPIFC